MADRNTASKDTERLPVKLAASAAAEMGHMAAANAAGFGVPASDAAGLTVVGVFDETVTNSGANGAVTATARRGKAYLFGNDGTNPVTQADLGKNVFVKNSATVCVTAGATNDIVAGKFLGFEGTQCWVEIG